MRIETGHVQFGDDWRAVVIRGDNACAFALALDEAIEELKKNKKFSEECAISSLSQISGLSALLHHSNEMLKDIPVQKLKPFVECV